MTDQRQVDVVRWTDQGGLAELLAAYHLCTEAEKGRAAKDVEDLPDRYRKEILNPQAAFLDDGVLIAQSGGSSIGCLVVTFPADGQSELKRLWTIPSYRGQGVASKLVNSAIEF